MTDIPEILIADDSKSNRISLAASATVLDVDILIASSGLETIRLAIEHQPALVILDADMPDMDGYQVMNQLAGNGRTTNIPVILMETNFSSRKSSLHGSSVWPMELLYKPINHEQLRTKLTSLMQLNEYRNAITTIQEFEDEMGDQADEGVIGVDLQGRIRYCNPAMIKMLRTKYSELLGTGLETVFEKDFHETDPRWSEHTVATALRSGKTVQVKKATLWTNDGGKVTTTFVAVPINNHPVLAGLLVFKDISRRSRSDEQITSLTTHDPLTGLANRFKFEEVLSGLIDLYKAKTNVLVSRKRSAPCAVLYVGLDHFSHINKGLGHDAGDKLLQGVAHRLRNCITDLDLVARLGGDEFTVALTHMFDANDATKTAQKIQKQLDEPFLIDGNEIFTSASIGIATYPECGDSSSELLTNSNLAMQTAKQNGRHGILFFTDSLNENYLEKVEFEAEIRDALAKDQLQIFFQAYLSRQQEITGHYATLLWQHPERGLIDVTDTLQSIEQNQIQTKLTYKLLRDGCIQYKKLLERTVANLDLKLVIPFPAYHMINSNFLSNLKAALEDSQLSPSQLMLEINESKVDFNLHEFKDLARSIADLGVHLALNLFSTPKTPLTHLFQLDLDAIRIHLSALDELEESPKSTIFLKSITGMAHDLGIEVIVDGITTEKQASILQGLKIDKMMGEYFSEASRLNYPD